MVVKRIVLVCAVTILGVLTFLVVKNDTKLFKKTVDSDYNNWRIQWDRERSQ